MKILLKETYYEANMATRNYTIIITLSFFDTKILLASVYMFDAI